MLFTLPIDVYFPNLICLHCSIVNIVASALKSGLPSLNAAGQDFINIYICIYWQRLSIGESKHVCLCVCAQ